MTYKNFSSRFYSVLLLIVFAFSSIQTQASGSEGEKFNPGTFIIDHVIDSYGWHITTFKGHSISIPLPVILWDQGKLVVFSSSKFHHGESAYKGYALGFTKETNGKIVKLKEPITGHFDHNPDLISNARFFDISISKNVFSLLLSVALLCVIFFSVAKSYKKRPQMAPKGLQSLMEIVIVFIRDEVVIPSIGYAKHQKFLPYILTLFFFILVNNLMGLIPIFPGGANVTGNIAVTGILALLTLLITSFSGSKSYWKHIFNTPGVPWWLKIPIPIMPIVEAMGIFTKPFVLMVRLFANITAGHIIILGFISLIFIFGAMNPYVGLAVSPLSLVFYLFMGLLELVVAFVQSYLFALLTAMYIGMALEDHEAHENH
ncbi:MAG TPA: F0F1 ATP synthase subunit A [Bacteroidales bacterium]|nr:F0F1 ATP synthase subunit A [Bacteroidales bacterium]